MTETNCNNVFKYFATENSIAYFLINKLCAVIIHIVETSLNVQYLAIWVIYL